MKLEQKITTMKRFKYKLDDLSWIIRKNSVSNLRLDASIDPRTDHLTVLNQFDKV